MSTADRRSNEESERLAGSLKEPIQKVWLFFL